MTPRADVNVTFERTFDLELIRTIITHHRIWPHVSDDGAGAPENYRPVDHPAIWYVTVLNHGELMGAWIFTPENSICWGVHTCLLPKAWGSFAHRAAREMCVWIWENTPCRRIVTTVPTYNRLALAFAKGAGMEQYGLNPQSYQKDGKMYDQILLGISRPETTCQ